MRAAAYTRYSGRLGAGASPARASAVAKMPMIILLFIDRLDVDGRGKPGHRGGLSG